MKRDVAKVGLFDSVPAERSALMAGVKSRDTRPEMTVRRLVHSMGYRYRLHRSELPGSPDLVFAARRKIIFVHGCFWHRHAGCKRTTTPKARSEFWEAKFRSNVERDTRIEKKLIGLGWEVLVVWECQTFDLKSLGPKLRSFLVREITHCLESEKV